MTTIEIPVRGMDCASCMQTVERAIDAVPGVESVTVLLAAEKAIVTLDQQRSGVEAIRRAVANAGYTVPPFAEPDNGQTGSAATPAVTVTAGTTVAWRRLALAGSLLVGLILLVAVVGEGLGLIDQVTGRVPFPIGVILVALLGAPVFRNVIVATLHRRVIAHTLMTVGVIAALVVGQWATAAIVVVFMRIGDLVESFTTNRSRGAMRDLLALAPQTARVARDGADGEASEIDVPVGSVPVGATVIIRPGERIPVDGEVIAGRASVDQSAITGEPMPLDVGPGQQVFATSLAAGGSLRIRVTGAGSDTTFGKVVQLVERAEASRADVQRVADRFATWFLPVVGTIAFLTFLLSRNVLATAAVLVVACSCSLAMATPVAMLATIGAAARRGLVIKGGRIVEQLARADILLVDKTGTLTMGRPVITDVVPRGDIDAHDLLTLVASVERDSEHPLAGAVRDLASGEGLVPMTVTDFAAIPGRGVRGIVGGRRITVERRPQDEAASWAPADALRQAGKTLLFVSRDDEPVGVLAATDQKRADVAPALAGIREAGIRHIELLTGDHDRAAARLATELGIAWQADLLPEDKIAIVQRYQAASHRVIMVGDGVNDAPALAQADVGIAMGATGTDIAIEVAHVVLMRDDWALVPDVIRTARRTMQVVRLNLGFTAVYNVVGLSLAAFGILPPILAAAAQSLPDIGILANSARLLRPARSKHGHPSTRSVPVERPVTGVAAFADLRHQDRDRDRLEKPSPGIHYPPS